MFKKVTALALVVIAVLAVGAATLAGTESTSTPEDKCTAALNADVDAFVAHPHRQTPPTSGRYCHKLSDRTNLLLFSRVEQSRANDIANAQLAEGN